MSLPQLPQGFLTGVRIVDFSWKTVGPWATRMLTPYGAEVIHIEPPHEPDDHRWDIRPAVGRNFDVLALWRERADNVSGRAVPCGHYIAEEAPDLLLAESNEFFRSTNPP